MPKQHRHLKVNTYEIARNIVFSFDLTCFRSFLQAGCHDFIEGILRKSVYEWDNGHFHRTEVLHPSLLLVT